MRKTQRPPKPVIRPEFLLFFFCLNNALSGYLLGATDALKEFMRGVGVSSSSGDETTLQLARVLNAATSSSLIMALPIGGFLDWFGPRLTLLVGILSNAISIALWTFCANSVAASYVAAVFMGIPQHAVLFSHLNIANLFPGNEGKVLGLLAAAAQASLLVPVFLKWLMVSVGQTAAVLIYLFTCLCSVVWSCILVPPSIFVAPDSVEEPASEASPLGVPRTSSFMLYTDGPRGSLTPTVNTPLRSGSHHSPSSVSRFSAILARSNSDLEQRTPLNESPEREKLVVVATAPLEALPLLKQCLSPAFWLFAIHFNWFVFRRNYFAQSVRQIFEEIAEQDGLPLSDGAWYTDTLNVMMPIPIFAYISFSLVDVWGFWPVLAKLNACGLLIFLTAGFLPLRFQWITMICFLHYINFTFAQMTVFVLQVFGYRTYGVLAGIMQISSLAGVLVYEPWMWIVQNWMDGSHIRACQWVALGSVVGFVVPPVVAYLVQWQTARITKAAAAGPARRQLS